MGQSWTFKRRTTISRYLNFHEEIFGHLLNKNIFVFSGLLVMGKHLLVAGGETTDQLGRTIILDSMETLVKKRWVPLRQKLPERRSRFSLIRIPRTYVN